MSQENVKLVREAFEAFLGGDSEKTAQLVDRGPGLIVHVALDAVLVDVVYAARQGAAINGRHPHPQAEVTAGNPSGSV